MIKEVSNDKAFWFCNNSGFVGKVAHNITEFADGLKTVSIDSLEFHLRGDKNDFEAWLKEIMQDPKLAEDVKKIKNKALKGEALKIALNKFAKKIPKSA